ncbi:hypothetical protein PMAYCL1PPCAC_14363, partial [Pristionchus mayeri]
HPAVILRVLPSPLFEPQEKRCISSVFAFSIILGCSIIIIISVVAITVLRRNQSNSSNELDSLHPAARILDSPLTLTDEYGSLIRVSCSIIILISVVAITVLRRKDRS